MKNILKAFIYLLLNIFLFSSNTYAIESFNAVSVIAIDPPTVTSPINLCQYSNASRLFVLPSTGCTLIWYESNSGGTGSKTPPLPITTNVGTFTYYVSQTDGVTESTRVPIVVNVVASSNSEYFDINLMYDYTKVTTGPDMVPPTALSSVYFYWSTNSPAPSSPRIYSYSYFISNSNFNIISPIIKGTTTDTHMEIFGILKGQNVTLTIASATNPCIHSVTNTSQIHCGPFIKNPDFPKIPSICQGSTSAPTLGNTSPNGLSGIWTPAVINTTKTGTFSYRFDPDPIAFPCANFQILNIEILPQTVPVFNSIPTSVCQGASAPLLPLKSNNTIPITGTWSPNSIDTSIPGTTTYTFMPDDPGQCPSTVPKSVTITVKPILTDAGFTSIAPLCIDSTAPILNNISPLGIKGTWAPLQINTNSAGTFPYTFTPEANQCAIQQNISVTVVPKKVTNFTPISPFCAGNTPPILASVSPNNVSGTWFPALVDNSASGTYVFTPNINECATKQTMNIKVNDPIHPDFSNISICSENSPPSLSTTSPNGITGTWNPTTIDNLNSHSYTFTPDSNQCAIPQTIDVTILPSKILTDFTSEVTEAFSNNQKITIFPIAPGNDYLYQLDDGLFQKSPVFENVTSGYHSVTVEDVMGCKNSITKDNILVIDYPKFFTPNNDGFNDTWNIFDLKDKSSSKIYIFDRFGKLLKNISPNGAGWDGTYTGIQMPATDYWFTIEYEEQGKTKKFRSHFSLKR